MIRSMTGYGTACCESDSLKATASVRCLNHRYLDTSIQCPRSLRSLEPGIRERVKGRVGRGRVDVVLQAVVLEDGGPRVTTSSMLVEGLVRSLREIESHYGLEGGVLVSDVARFPGALEVEAAGEVGEAVRQQLLGLVEAALDGLDEMRRAEGRGLAGHLRDALGVIEQSTQRLASLAGKAAEASLAGLVEKGRRLAEELGLEEARLYPELARLVDRHDIEEELQRLASHVEQAGALLETEGPCGKRLDFLAQELMREANTVGSKAASAVMVQEVVSLKTAIERLREQVQNVE
jgi:uncharacterized protein (TIGR00255 family)